MYSIGEYIHMIPHGLTICNTNIVNPYIFVEYHEIEVYFMDIMLDRILSLIPRKPDGKFKHGALKEFAVRLGFKDGHIISDWIAGNATSYKNYLYEISDIYGVSIEWLRGESTQKEKPTPVSKSDKYAYSVINGLQTWCNSKCNRALY